MSKHRIFTVPEVLSERTEDRVSSKGNALIYRILTMKYTFYTDDGSSISCTVIGEGMDVLDRDAVIDAFRRRAELYNSKAARCGHQPDITTDRSFVFRDHQAAIEWLASEIGILDDMRARGYVTVDDD